MSLRHLARVARLASLTAVTVVALGVGPVSRAEAPPTSEPVAADTSPSTARPRILLTNDDGWAGGGLLTLYEALTQAGFNVVVFAPADDETGSSASMTFSGELEISRTFSNIFAVDGSPADAVEVGISLAFAPDPPDLVISGPNPGFNVGDAVIHSGNLGGVVTALNDGVPAIAVNTGPNPQTSEADFTTTNTFVIALVNALETHAAGEPLLPEGVGLNVNVPFTGADTPPLGVAITSTDRGDVDPDYAGVELPAAGESVVVAPQIVEIPTVDAGSDSEAIAEGMVAITFIEGNYDATDNDGRAEAVAALTPVLTGILGDGG